MDIQINDKTARTMAERLRAAVGAEHLSQSKAFETLATTLGFKNWDILSGVLKKDDKPAHGVQLDEPVELLLPCFNTSEWGEAPPYCKVAVDREFLGRVLEQSKLCAQHDLTEVRTYYGPQWGPEDEESLPEGVDSMRINFTELVTDKTSFWFAGHVKHSDECIETRMLTIELLVEALKSRKSPVDYLVWHKGHLVFETSGDMDARIDELKDYGEL